VVNYSEPVEQSSATNINNYAINNVINISSASLDSTFKTVTLFTSSHTPGAVYTVAVNNVLDQASNSNPIAPNTEVEYMASGQVNVSNLIVASGESYEVIYTLDNGDSVYIDRNFGYDDLPSNIIGNDITYIKTANDDKQSQGNQFITFDIDQNAKVYIAHDNRYQTKPDWLADFTNTAQMIIISGSKHTLFVKTFTAGQVTLGGNIHPSEPENNDMYSIIICKATSTGISKSHNVPSTIELFQNYPNPFNSDTNIKFSLTKSEYVSLKVFNIAGEIVSNILNNALINGGDYEVPFDASQLASGVYFYRLATRSGFYKETKKMILMK